MYTSKQSTTSLSLVGAAYSRGQAELAKRTDEDRKKSGQFLTPPEVALYMASDLGFLPEDARLLDPAIGSGVLSCAVVQRVIERGFPKRLHIIGYDTDEELCKLARDMLGRAVDSAKEYDIDVSFEVHCSDFLEAHLPNIAPTLFSTEHQKYNAIISNPPYFKLSKTNPYVRWLSNHLSGTTNIYTLFMGVCAKILTPAGRSVFIVPRSFCSGTYFAKFRTNFSKDIVPLKLHIFESRKEAFKDDEVLQENIILSFRTPKPNEVWQKIDITSSKDIKALHTAVKREINRDLFLARNEGGIYFRLPASELDERILSIMDSWQYTLRSYGFEVSTGPVIPFRARTLLADTDAVERGEAVPLYWMQNVRANSLTWPAERGKKPQGFYSGKESACLLVKARNYVFIRRFSTKEERRRLTAAPFLTTYQACNNIAIENHLNYLHRGDDVLSAAEARGLSALLNSAVVDRYFRILNGHTQVNATDLRELPLPSQNVITLIGERVMRMDLTQYDDVVFDVLQEHQFLPPDFPKFTETRASMSKIKEAQDLLKTLGLPKKQQNEMAALTLLVLAQLSEDTPWNEAKKKALRIHDILGEMVTRYDRNYAENTRESVRRQVIHQFEQAGILARNPNEPELPTNSPRTHYALTDEVLKAIRAYGSNTWVDAAVEFLESQRSLIERYRAKKERNLVPLKLPTGEEYHLSPGAHNVLQVDIIEKFGPQFAPGARPLYVGDTANKTLHIDRAGFKAIEIAIPSHDKLPDVVLYDTQKDWVYLIEAVTSHGPVSPKRLVELRELLLKDTQAEAIFVTAFPDFKTFKEHIFDIAWETEVWIADQPSHMIHFNGDKFLKP